MGKELITDNPLLTGTFELENTSQAEVLRTLRDAVTIRRQQVAEIIRYPLGFLRLTLSGSRTEDGFHLHVWPPGLSRSEAIHAHTFELASRVLRAHVTDSLWEIHRDDPHPSHELFRPVYQGSTSTGERRVEGNVRAELLQERRYNKGDFYRVPKGHFHSSGVDENTLAVTLIRKSQCDKEAVPPVLLPLTNPGTAGAPVEKLDQKIAWEIVMDSVQSLEE